MDPAKPTILIVPMEIHALPVGQTLLPVADVAHKFDIEDTQPQTPWLGQHTEPQFFATANTLQPGIHLHWSLPQALTRGAVTFVINNTVWQTLAWEGFPEPVSAALRDDLQLQPPGGFPSRRELEDALVSALLDFYEGETADQVQGLKGWISSAVHGRLQFRVVPNRWLVTRTVPDQAGIPAQSWIVESDLLWQGDGDAQDPCPIQNSLSPTIPNTPQKLSEVTRSTKLYRRLGKVFPLDQWQEAGPNLPRHKPHTALGYGNPTFAAALPHCYNVFGLYDPLDDLLKAGGDNFSLAYSVVGWFSEANDDPLSKLNGAGPSPITFTADLSSTYAWWCAPEANQVLPERTVIYGRLQHIPWSKEGQPAYKPQPVQVAIGSSTSEALSALLARQPDLHHLSGIERYLNALQQGLLAKVRANQPGFLKEWDEALHKQDFGVVKSGSLWTIKDYSQKSSPDGPGRLPGEEDRAMQQAARQIDYPLPEELAGPINELNSQQAFCDRLQAEINSLRAQLFGDWCNYLSIYHFDPQIEAAELARKLGQISAAGTQLEKMLQQIQSHEEQLAVGLQRRDEELVKLSDQLQDLQTRQTGPPLDYRLQRIGAPRFYHPQEPVILLSGSDARPAKSPMATRAGEAGEPDQLICSLYQPTKPGLDGSPLALAVTSYCANATAAGTATHQEWQPPWRPVMIHWEVEFHAAEKLAKSSYDPDHILSGYHFDANHPNDLSFAPEKRHQYPDIYQGSILITAGAEAQIIEQARNYLRENPQPQDAQQEVHKQLLALANMDPLPIQSQALSGFNAALLARRQSIQLPVIDPNARSGPDLQLALQVNKGVGAKNNASALSDVQFNPLRSGRILLSRLWLIDAFGQVVVVVDQHNLPAAWNNSHLVDSSQVIRAQNLIPPEPGQRDNLIALRPRLVQPARLNFRWRSAEDDQVEMNSHPFSSPIFGWLLANHLENSLALYDSKGKALGSFNMEGPLWQGAPGKFFEQEIPAVIQSRHLLDFAQGIAEAGGGANRAYLQALINAVNEMTQHVLPHNYSQHEGLSLLVGRPLALVRASLGLELLGLPAYDQDLKSYNEWVAGGPRRDQGITHLKFPVRLGHKGHLNDGLVGYFIEDARGQTTYKTFYVEAVTGSKAAGVRAPAFDQLTVTPKPGGHAEKRLTLIIDPRAPIHVTTGILPVKQIDIPPQMFAEAIRQMAITFPVTPFLSPRSSGRPQKGAPGIGLPTPVEPGYVWSLIRHWAAAPRWTTEPTSPVNRQADFSTHPQQLLEGWLKLQTEEEKPIIPKSKKSGF